MKVVKLKEHIDTHTLKHLIKGKLTHTHRYVCMYFKIMHTHHNVNLSLLIVCVPFNRKEREFTQKKTAAHKYHEKNKRTLYRQCMYYITGELNEV